MKNLNSLRLQPSSEVVRWNILFHDNDHKPLLIEKMNKLIFKLGTRGSPLALWQAERVTALLLAKRPEITVETVIIHTLGDKILDKPLVQVGGKGIFTKEIENALLAGEIDFAVHSYKDLPTVLPEGLDIVSVPERDSPYDALFSEKAENLKDLPPAPVIATGSLRRRAQVLAVRPDAEIEDLRGNVNTRLKKYRESDWDGMIMAHAGIRRMGWEDQIAGILSPLEMLPAPAQGALAIEAREDDRETHEFLQSIHDSRTALGVQAERCFLATLEGGCQVPIGAYAILEKKQLTLHGLVSSLDGTRCIRRTLKGEARDAASLGRRLAHEIYENGGKEIIEELKALNH